MDSTDLECVPPAQEQTPILDPEFSAEVIQPRSRSFSKRFFVRIAAGAFLFGLTLLVASCVVPHLPTRQMTGEEHIVSFVEKKSVDQPDGEMMASMVHEGNPLNLSKGTEAPVHIPDQGMGFPSNTFAPTIFCFSVMNADNPMEIETIQGQLRNRIGIFACDNVAVISGRRMVLGDGHSLPNGTKVQVETWYSPAKPVQMGNFLAGDNTNSFKNTDIFIRTWRILLESKALLGHDWTVKVDPDAVFFPYRLRWHLQNISSLYKPLYTKNCNYKGQAALYGSLEVFSLQAIKNLENSIDRCEHEIDWVHWGEDQWIDTCMWKLSNAVPINDFQLVGDHRCMDAQCSDTWRAAFHDYKSWQKYKQCHDTSMGAEKMRKKMEKLKESPQFCCTYSWDPSDPCNKCGSKVHPGSGFCGSSKSSCLGCGAATWCTSSGSEQAVSA